MATKNNPGQFDCYAAAAPDEPLFVLRSRDQVAPELVRIWACLRSQHYNKARRILDKLQGMTQNNDPRKDAKWEEALECAAQMELYRRTHQ